MSELKVYHCNEWHNEYTEFYLKSDVDKVIAEKDKKIDLYKRGWEESDRINEHLYAQLCHNKYKRCLAMAGWCAAECVVNQNTYKRFFTHKSEFRIGHFRKWYFRWLELAEKFKEAK